MKKILIWIFAFTMLASMATATVTRQFTSHNDGTKDYVCEDVPYRLIVAGAGAGYGLVEDITGTGWTFTGVSPTSDCAINSPTKVTCSAAAASRTITLSVSNTGSIPGVFSSPFSGTYSDSSHAPGTTIDGPTQIYVKINTCRPDVDTDLYYPGAGPAEIVCTCLGGNDCDDNPADDPNTIPGLGNACLNPFATNYPPPDPLRNANQINPGISEGQTMCEDGYDQNCDGKDTPCASTVSRDLPDKFEGGLPFTVSLDLKATGGEPQLVVDEHYNDSIFNCTGANFGGSCALPGIARWIINNPNPASIMAGGNKLEYTLVTLDPLSPVPEDLYQTIPIEFDGLYRYSGGDRVTTTIGGDLSTLCIDDEMLCTPQPGYSCDNDTLDNDCDGLPDCWDPDTPCFEICYDGIDNNFNGLIDFGLIGNTESDYSCQGAVNGTVQDVNGMPIEGASITFTGSHNGIYPPLGIVPTFTSTALTNSNGDFIWRVPGNTTYDVKVSHNEYLPTTISAINVPILGYVDLGVIVLDGKDFPCRADCTLKGTNRCSTSCASTEPNGHPDCTNFQPECIERKRGHVVDAGGGMVIVCCDGSPTSEVPEIVESAEHEAGLDTLTITRIFNWGGKAVKMVISVFG